jgi:hypothetical protein
MRKSLPPVRFLLGVRSFLRTLTMVSLSLRQRISCTPVFFHLSQFSSA